jgi:hypothetical protein
VNNLRSLMSATLLALALVAPAARAADETPNPWKFEFHGFVTASMYYQDQTFVNGQGQGLWLAAPTPSNLAKCRVSGAFTCAAGTATKTGSDLSGDVRNSRFSFSMAGPKVFGDAQPRGYLEFDFFGLNGAGTFATEQQIPRLRVGYAELKFGATNVQVGQQNQLVVQQIPGSISHIANPVSYQAGTIGWRTPGVRVTQVVAMGDNKLTFAAEAVKNKWSNEAANAVNGAATTNTPVGIGFGEASGLPMFQGLARVDGKAGDLSYTGYLVGVYHSIHLPGFGDGSALPAAAAGKKDITGYVGEIGGKVTFAPVSLSVNAYTGKATGNMLGSMVVFGDIKDMGYWASLSGGLSKEFTITLTYGANKPDEKDIRKWGGNRLKNSMVGGMLKYQDGGYALALEGYQLTTTYANSATTSTDTAALQVLATAGYFF